MCSPISSASSPVSRSANLAEPFAPEPLTTMLWHRATARHGARARRHETLERRDIAAEVRLTGGGSGGLGNRANHLLTTTQDSPNHVSCGPPLEFIVPHLAWKKSVSMKRQPAAPYFRSTRPRIPSQTPRRQALSLGRRSFSIKGIPYVGAWTGSTEPLVDASLRPNRPRTSSTPSG